MSDFVEIVKPTRIASDKGYRVVIAPDCAVAVFDMGERVYAVDDLCVRCGASLADGCLHGTVVHCNGCDWRYDITSGCVNDIPALRIDTFEAKVVDLRILIATTASP